MTKRTTKAPGWRQAGGFTLIELSVVLLIIGLLLSGGLLASATILEENKRRETDLNMDRVEQALTLFVAQQGVLPCPDTSATPDGLQDDPCTEADDVVSGAVPWVTLGLTGGVSRDGWGRLLTYAIQESYGPPPGGSVDIDCVFLSSGAPAGSPIELNNAAGDSPVDDGGLDWAAPAYVLISHGSDGSEATMPSGAAYTFEAAESNVEEQENGDGDAVYHYESGNPGFDDLVRGRSPGQILLESGICS